MKTKVHRSLLVPLMRQSIIDLLEICQTEQLDSNPGYARLMGSAEGLLQHIELQTSEKPDFIPDEEIAAMYQSGLSMLDVANHFGIATTTVVAALRRLGLKPRPRGPDMNSPSRRYSVKNRDRIERMKKLWGEGKTLEMIGTEFNITRERVRQLLLREGVDTSVRPLTPQELEWTKEYADGASLMEVAERHFIGTNHLRNLCTRAGVAIRPSPRAGGHSPRILRNAEIAAEMYKRGRTVEEIANRLGYNARKAGGTVYRLLAIAGIAPSRNAQYTRRFN